MDSVKIVAPAAALTAKTRARIKTAVTDILQAETQLGRLEKKYSGDLTNISGRLASMELLLQSAAAPAADLSSVDRIQRAVSSISPFASCFFCIRIFSAAICLIFSCDI